MANPRLACMLATLGREQDYLPIWAAATWRDRSIQVCRDAPNHKLGRWWRAALRLGTLQGFLDNVFSCVIASCFRLRSCLPWF